jgi:hypothetical protein
MLATIYVTKEAMAAALALKDLDYYDRLALSDDEGKDPTKREGYYLKNANSLPLAALPETAQIALRITPANPAMYTGHISMPANLRGCVFEKAPHLPEQYAEIVTYWSGKTVNAKDGGAVYFQNPLNEYMVDLTALQATVGGEVEGDSSAKMDELLSEGVVVCLAGLGALVQSFPMDHFVEIEIPVDEAMLGSESGNFRSQADYDNRPSSQSERIFLKVTDILQSPDPDRIYADLLRHELLDYGYFY